ncbi:hypothetical protein SESBI_16128 [Sesbania bispinosa]|nr:hypothetical protein SESBI_16128 [Sesbania bispinosa]
MNRLSIVEEDEELEVQVGDCNVGGQGVGFNPGLCLVGRFLTDKPIRTHIMKERMASVWVQKAAIWRWRAVAERGGPTNMGCTKSGRDRKSRGSFVKSGRKRLGEKSAKSNQFGINAKKSSPSQ